MSENKIFSNGHQVRKIKINAQWWTNCTRWFYNLDLSTIRLEQKTYFMNCEVQLNMVAWQTDWGTLSWLSERRNCGTWERSSASDRASECASACASASNTQSQQFARHFCECNVTFQQMKLGTTVIPHSRVILTGQSIPIIFMTLQGQKLNFKVKQGTCVGLIPLFHMILTWKSIYGISMVIQSHIQGRKVNSEVLCV